MVEPRVRIDQLLVEQALAPTREKAQRLLMAGEIFVDGVRVDKPGTRVRAASTLEHRGRGLRFVSRGGLKLEKALEAFSIAVDGCVAVDLGASTGGFTDCLLQRGARRVFAVDVGRGQLSQRLREDPRVVVKERTNARHLSPDAIGIPADLVTCDLSFISLGLILPAARRLMKEGGWLVALIKPQFEAGPAQVGRGGVVRDPEVQGAVIARVVTQARLEGLALRGLTFSPVKGPAGNLEFLAGFQPGPVPPRPDPTPSCPSLAAWVEETVRAAHAALTRPAGSLEAEEERP